MLQPASIPELCEAVLSAPRVIAVGARTKPALSAVEATPISMLSLKGMIEYDPSEFTFTALAGTPILEIQSALAERGQYLPFDPLLVESGSTLGGAVASGLSGPGRFRYGGLRDFILGIRFVDGGGKCLRMGGKVVKNAAGFDFPKFMVGSLGRFGVLAELTFKVFPCPPSVLSLRVPLDSMASAIERMAEAGKARWELDALDVPPKQNFLAMRLRGSVAALESLSREIIGRFGGELMDADKARELWRTLCEFNWCDSGERLLKAPMTPELIAGFSARLAEIREISCWYSAGGNVAYIAGAPGTLEEVINSSNLQGLALRGSGPLWVGKHQLPEIVQRVKNALDPQGRFPDPV